FESATSKDRKIMYLGQGDSALFTGLYLAAESYRYHVTGSDEALSYVRRTLAGIKKLSLISGNGMLARAIYPVDGELVEQFLKTYSPDYIQTGRLDGRDYYWMGRTSRDQYAGIYFGLSVAYDFVNDEDLRNEVREIITRLTEHLLKKNWFVYNADGSIRTTFVGRTDQQLSILQVARHVNPGRFAKEYESFAWWHAGGTWWPMWLESLDLKNSYFKYNLASLYWFNLLRLEPEGSKHRKKYRDAYSHYWKTVRGHQNAHFNMVDRALFGADDGRDQQTRDLLDQFLTRGLRHKTVDLRDKYKACSDNWSCDPIPVAERASSDFIWQREPFLLFQEGDERVEGPGIDYLLPYWMARAYGVL
ncbi:MAG TPA: hypothetical protein VFV50_05575, partial [Bdellovibrionales bacterium]|nr:hypothetical protein [Bdellovibrionales bacterium]